ncbi:MAG: hypothetical protein JNL08_19475 [Planctomycetes bacterium]|nr:hypothetical protein [Planctomycetota bacterium]
MRVPCRSFAVLLLATVPVAAQRLVVYGPTSGGMVEVQPPMFVLQAVPAAIPPVLGYAALPPLPALPGFGDSSFDNLRGHLWFSDGFTLAAMASPSVPPTAPPPPPVPLTPAVLAITGGPVTGIAFDPVGGVMFVCGPTSPIVGVLPAPGTPIVVPPFAIPWPTGPIAGLDFDASTGLLHAVDLFGVTYDCLVGGGAVSVPWAPPMPLPGPAGDVVIDRTQRNNQWGLRPLYVVAGWSVLDVREQVPTVFAGGALAGEGLAFVNFPASMPPTATCVCTGTGYPRPLFTTGPMTLGNATFGVGHGGLPPGLPMLFVFDVIGSVNPSYPWINAVGCGLGLLPGSPGLVPLSAVADAAGNAILSVPLTGPAMPLGTVLSLQSVTFCASDPVFGLVFTPFAALFVASV